MARRGSAQFQKTIQQASTEEEVKAAYAKCFNIPYKTKKHRDTITENLLFEFKFNKGFTRAKGRATVLAQALYYVRKIKYSDDPQKLPMYICIASEKAASFFEVADWSGFYSSDAYDWSLTPSTPDPKLVEALAAHSGVKGVEVFSVQDATEFETFSIMMDACLAGSVNAKTPDKKPISDINFLTAYNSWAKHFEEVVRNGIKPSMYFICDIQAGNSRLVEELGVVQFQVKSHVWVDKPIPFGDYKNFWSIYDRVSNQMVMRSLYAKADRLTGDDMRRREGEFFTPIPFANVALKHIEDAIGKDWWNKGYRLWDMAAGTGNLEWDLPADAWSKIYLSTLHQPDVDHCTRLFSGATCFQYDYLNDDVDLRFAGGAPNQFTSWKMPKNLLHDLGDPSIKWIILINPPFATSGDAGRDSDSKRDVSMTAIRTIMHDQGLGATSRELFAQFIFRLKHEFAGKSAHLGLFSKIKYLNAPNDAPLRDQVFKATFVSGFIFSSVNFAGTSRSAQFPVGFLLWDLKKPKELKDQDVWVDVFNEEVQKVGRKQIITNHGSTTLATWVPRPRTTPAVMPPFRSALEIAGGGPDVRHRVAPGFLASLMCKGNELQNQNNTALFSGPYVSAGALSITKDNFERAMVVHAVRRLPLKDWTNDRDPLLAPSTTLPDNFISDCVVWSLFSPSNNTVALANVKYEKAIYQIQNNLFPVPVADMGKWDISEQSLRDGLMSATDRYASQWLTGKTLTNEAKAVLEAGVQVYQTFFREPGGVGVRKFKISTWDPGWAQVRWALEANSKGANELKAFVEAFKALSVSLLPQVYSHGFLATTKQNEVVPDE